jgi:hypothetical protein
MGQGPTEQVTSEIPSCLLSGGQIIRRQTTFWDLSGRYQSGHVRVHFDHKVEFRFVRSEFESIAVFAEHPVLLDHNEPEEAIYISAPAIEPERVLLDLHAEALAFFQGWRQIEHYLNPDFPPAKVLADGSGMLMRVPVPFAGVCKRVLAQAGARVDRPMPGKSTTSAARAVALVLGQNFVVAASFRFELL